MAEDKSVPQGANKYSVYAQRDVDSTQFNWANAAADITKSFTDVRDDRKKRKEDLEDGFDKSMSLLQEVEAMQTKTGGEKITAASQMSVDALVKQNELMQDGKISVRDYQRFLGRLKSGYANVSKVAKVWDTWQGETNTRMTEGKSGYLEIGNAQDVQPLGEFSEHELVTNPFTGNLSYAKLIEDPNDPTKKILPKDASDYIPPSQVFASMKYRQNKYDVRKAVTGITDNVATVITAFQESYEKDGSGGSVKSLEGFRQIGKVSGVGYDQWLESSIDSVVNDTTAGQILYDNGYGAAKSKEDFNKRFPNLTLDKWIKYKNDNGVLTPDYQPDQLEAAKTIVRDMIESQIDSKFTQTSGTGPKSETAAQTALRLKNEAVIVDLDTAANIAAGNLDDFLSSGSQGIIDVNRRLTEAGISSKDGFIDSITRQGDEIIIEYQSTRKSTPIKRKNENGTFRTTEEITKEVYQLISPNGKSFVNDLATAKKGGFTFGSNVRNKTEAEVESMLEINKATEYLIDSGVANPTPAQITDAIESGEVDQITQAELKEAMESGDIPQIYVGEDAVQYASIEPLKAKNVGDNIQRSVGANMNDTTGADYIKQKYNSVMDEDDDNLTTSTIYGPSFDGPVDRAKALQGPMQATLNAYLPKQLKGKVKMTLTDDGKIKVNYEGEDKDLDITGVTNITLGQEEPFVKLDAITNQIAQDVTLRYNTVRGSRKGGSPTPTTLVIDNIIDTQPTTVQPINALEGDDLAVIEGSDPITEDVVTEDVVTEDVVTEDVVFPDDEGFDLYRSNINYDTLTDNEVVLDENEAAYMEKLIQKRIALSKKSDSSGSANADGRVEILKSIANDSTLTDKEKKAIYRRYTYIDDLHHSYLEDFSDSPYQIKAREILKSNMTISEMEKELEDLVEKDKSGKEKKKIPLTKPANDSIPALENYEGFINGSPTADIFTKLIKDKTYFLGAKGTGNWTMKDEKNVQTSVDSIDCSGAICTIRNAQGGKYDLNYTNAKKFKELAKQRNIPIESAKDGNLILMNVDGNGIDHIGFIIVDENGKKYIAESSSSYGGTTITEFDKRIADLTKRKTEFSYEIVSDTKQK